MRKMRRRTSKSASCNTHELAIHLALPHQLATKTTPCVSMLTFFLGDRKVGVASLAIGEAVKVIGDYLALIYLRTIEKNPGPPLTEEQRDAALSQIGSILGVLQNVQADLKTVKNTCDTVKLEIEALQQSFEQRFEKNEKTVDTMKIELQETQQRLSQLERHARRNNIVIFGIPADIAVPDALQTVLRDAISLEQVPEYKTAYRLGKNTAKPPILVRLREQKDKENIMAKVSNLKGTKISINHDLTPEEQATRRTIVAAAKLATSRNIPCRVRRTGLLVNNQLLLPVELCNPDWVKDFIQPLSSNSGQPPPQGRGGASKRTFANIVSPGSAAAAAIEDFRRPRSSTTDSQSEKAGGRPKRGLSKEDNRQKSK
jgi:hypothetical protein